MKNKIFLTLMFLFIFINLLNAATLEFTYHFNAPKVKNSHVEYQTIHFQDCIQAGKIGEPSFPVKGISLLLPPGEVAKEVQILPEDRFKIGTQFKILPKQPPLPYSAGGNFDFAKNEAVYQQDSFLSYLEPEFSTQFMNGHSILLATFSPVEYNPKTQELYYYEKVKILVETESSERGSNALSMLKNSEKIHDKIGKMVDNPENLGLYPIETRDNTDDYEYLIITSQAYEGSLEDLMEFYKKRGIRTKIFTTQMIEANYAGMDLQEKIRNCVIDEYQNHNIQFLLLAGDSDPQNVGQYIAPHRGLYTTVNSPHGSNDWITDNDIPSDIYYAALDGTWNDDNDDKWGEEDEDDLLPEIAVGRIPIDMGIEAQRFVNKTTSYQESPVTTDITRALMLGEFLYGDPYETWGADMLEQLIDFCDEDGYSTYGIPSDVFTIEEKYEREGINWSGTDVINWANQGTHLILHNGHANVHYGMKMQVEQVTDNNFYNCNGIDHNYTIPITQGCLSGSFDNRSSYAGWYDGQDCIAEEWLSINNFAVAAIANSRYGWFVEGSTDGPGQHLHRELLDAIFGEDITALGEALSRCKVETAPYVELPDQWEDGALRWNFYCINLLGDPALDVWTDTPQNFESVNYPEEISTEVEVVQVETGVANALVALYRYGTLFGRAYADSNGVALVNITEPLQSNWNLDITVTAHNYLAYEGGISVVGSHVIDENGNLNVPTRFALGQNYPNPFNPETTISFELPTNGGNARGVKLAIYDVSGKLVKSLIDGEKEAGYHSVIWDGKDGIGREVNSGVYFYELEAGNDYSETRKMILLK